jgi:hypothetical protein
VRLIPADDAVLLDAGEPLTPEQAKARRESLGLPDPNRLLVPTVEEVARLPAAARAAFGRRCALRVGSLAGVPAPVELDARATAALIVAAATVHSPLRRWLRCIRRDFDRLVYLAKKHKWSDDTPVPPDVFGPLWPADLVPLWAKEPL